MALSATSAIEAAQQRLREARERLLSMLRAELGAGAPELGTPVDIGTSLNSGSARPPGSSDDTVRASEPAMHAGAGDAQSKPAQGTVPARVATEPQADLLHPRKPAWSRPPSELQVMAQPSSAAARQFALAPFDGTDIPSFASDSKNLGHARVARDARPVPGPSTAIRAHSRTASARASGRHPLGRQGDRQASGARTAAPSLPHPRLRVATASGGLPLARVGTLSAVSADAATASHQFPVSRQAGSRPRSIAANGPSSSGRQRRRQERSAVRPAQGRTHRASAPQRERAAERSSLEGRGRAAARSFDLGLGPAHRAEIKRLRAARQRHEETMGRLAMQELRRSPVRDRPMRPSAGEWAGAPASAAGGRNRRGSHLQRPAKKPLPQSALTSGLFVPGPPALARRPFVHLADPSAVPSEAAAVQSPGTIPSHAPGTALSAPREPASPPRARGSSGSCSSPESVDDISSPLRHQTH